MFVGHALVRGYKAYLDVKQKVRMSCFMLYLWCIRNYNKPFLSGPVCVPPVLWACMRVFPGGI